MFFKLHAVLRLLSSFSPKCSNTFSPALLTWTIIFLPFCLRTRFQVSLPYFATSGIFRIILRVYLRALFYQSVILLLCLSSDLSLQAFSALRSGGDSGVPMKPVAVLLVRVLWVLTARRIRLTYREFFFTALLMRIPLFLGMTCVNWLIFRLRLSTVAATEFRRVWSFLPPGVDRPHFSCCSTYLIS